MLYYNGLMKKTDRAWLAGIIEGEGYLGWNVVKAYQGRNRPSYRAPVIEVGMNDRDIVRRVAKFFCKNLLGPYRYGKNQSNHYQTQVFGKDTIRILHFIRPWLGKRRGRKADELLQWEHRWHKR